MITRGGLLGPWFFLGLGSPFRLGCRHLTTLPSSGVRLVQFCGVEFLYDVDDLFFQIVV
jgi:hypothetical protein